MLNATVEACGNGPPLPSYTLKPTPPLLSGISDTGLSLLLPFVAYWGFSLIFQLIESSGWGDRLQPFNTSTEKLVRNRVSKIYVLCYIMGNFAIQGTIAWGLSRLGAEDMVGREEYDIAVWRRRVHAIQRWIPTMFGVIGIDSVKLAEHIAGSVPALAIVLAGGTLDPIPKGVAQRAGCSTLGSSEVLLARLLYYYIIPSFQFFIAFSVTDVWQYFGHRLLHEWKWLYR